MTGYFKTSSNLRLRVPPNSNQEYPTRRQEIRAEIVEQLSKSDQE
jgi:hypothetical protein